MMFQPSLCLSFGIFGEERIYRVEEVASILECDPGHVYDLIKLEKSQPGCGLIALNIGTSRKPTYRVRHSALAWFFEQRATQPARDSVVESHPRTKRTARHGNAMKEEPERPSGGFAERYVARRARHSNGG
jgi:hypothetical protein